MAAIPYTQEEIDSKFNQVIELIEDGKPLYKVLPSLNISSRTFFQWVEKDESKGKQYARALEIRAEKKFESIESDYLENPQRDPETGKIDPAWVNLQRLKIDAKKWELSKMLPKKYGDRLELENKHSGSVNIISLGSGQKPNESDN